MTVMLLYMRSEELIRGRYGKAKRKARREDRRKNRIRGVSRRWQATIFPASVPPKTLKKRGVSPSQFLLLQGAFCESKAGNISPWKCM